MSDLCKSLHEQLESLPLFSFPFEQNSLPANGIYFFYEKGEWWGHGGMKQRTVRIGTHKDGNFRSRIAEHFVLNERKMNFSAGSPAPHERSIFRKNIGRALLNRDRDSYLVVWEIDFTSRLARQQKAHLRDVEKEKHIEAEVSRIMRENFCFRFIVVEEEFQRMGGSGLESRLIGTVANCKLCRPSRNWLGNFSPKTKIRESGLWLEQHLSSPQVSETDMETVSEAVARHRVD